jgi:hypothetical protein
MSIYRGMPITSVKYFNPKQISGCSLWLDSADSNATGGGVNVSTWLDKSGNGNTATNQGSAGTITSTAAGLVFNGSGYMYIPGLSGSLVNKPFVIFMVETLNTTNQCTLLGDDSSANYGTDNVLHILYRNTSDLALGFYGDDLEDTVISGTGNKRLWAFYLPLASNRVTRRNGAVDVTHGNYTRLNYFTTPSIGRSFGGNQYIGTISEIIIYPSDIGVTAIQKVEGYLAQKWSITLATGHPGLTQTFYGTKYNYNLTISKTPYYQKFSPTQISGNVLWLDAADSSTMTFSSGSNISQWRDKSSLNNHATGTGSPVLTANSINGYQAIVLSSGPYFTGSTSVTGSTVTVFCVALTSKTLPNVSSDQRLVSLENGVNVDYGRTDGTIALFNQSSSSSIATWRVSGPVASSAISQNVSFQAVSKYDGTNGYLWKNGTSGGSSASSGTFAITKYGIGNQANPSGEYWIGSIGEVLIYNVALSDTNRQLIESYLAQKWGLVAFLPASGHIQNTFPVGSPTGLQSVTTSIVPSLTYLYKKMTTFTSFRWTITAGTTDSLVQFSEFQVGYNSTQIVFASPTTSTTGSTITWNTANGEGPAQAVDNNINTKGLGIGTSGLVLIVTVASPITANMYRWATANDVTPGRNPTQWTVDGSTDGVTYQRLHTQNTAYSTPNTTYTFTSWINFTYA